MTRGRTDDPEIGICCCKEEIWTAVTISQGIAREIAQGNLVALAAVVKWILQENAVVDMNGMGCAMSAANRMEIDFDTARHGDSHVAPSNPELAKENGCVGTRDVEEDEIAIVTVPKAGSFHPLFFPRTWKAKDPVRAQRR